MTLTLKMVTAISDVPTNGTQMIHHFLAKLNMVTIGSTHTDG